ncbi:MAG: Opr family porin [Arcobacteraceae bacterium]
MKKIYMSMVAAAVLSTGAYAESNSIKEAFANGKVSGDISLYTESTSKNGANKDSAFTNSSIGIQYETDSFNGFKAAIGGRTNHKFTEKEDGDYINSYTEDSNNDSEAVLSTANISYTADMGSLTVGRQEIDLEWIGDYHEAVIGAVTAIPDTTIVIGHTTRFMEANADTNLGKMADIGDGGASVIDVKYAGIENTVINPYFMTASMNDDDDFNAYGLKATTTVANIDLTAHYAATNEDKSGQDDGSIAHLEVATTIEMISLAAGYITTDKDGGIGSISSLGDNIDPSEDLGNIYGTDADTFYANISAEINIFTLGAQYATVNYDDSANGNSDDAKDSEILLTAGVAITDELSFDALYSSVDAENSDDDTDKVLAMLTYSF